MKNENYSESYTIYHMIFIIYSLHRLRLRLQRKKNEDPESKKKYYCRVSYIPVAKFNLTTKRVDEAEEQKMEVDA